MSRTGILGQSSFQRLPAPEPKPAKGPRMRKCAICRTLFAPRDLMRDKWCSIDCGAVLGQRLAAKVKAKTARADRATTRAALEQLRPRRFYIDQAQASFNKWVRARDAELPCVSCGRHHQGENHAGHFLSAGAHPNLRYHEQNVWKQCQPCNTHLSGNALNYRRGLVARIGLESVEALESDQAPRHYTIDDLKAITALYRRKLKEITP